MMLVIQPRDNAIRFGARKRRIRSGYRLITEAPSQRPAPTYLEVGRRTATWMAELTRDIAQSSVFDALGDRPMTAHVLGGAVIGTDRTPASSTADCGSSATRT